jgi:selenocysteine lyase/cysteine desulfurase
MNTQLEALRKQFPVTNQYAYLNNAGVAPLCLPAANAVKDFADEALMHGAARYKSIYDRCEAVRTSFAKLVNAAPAEIAFVANTSDGLSLVANGIDWKAGDRVLVPEHEFPANVYPWLNLERLGVVVERIPFVENRCPPEQIEKYIAGARLLSVSAVSFANGYRFDLEALGEMCAQHGVLFCVDGIQALGALPVDVKKCRIDFMPADGHKWLVGPEGAGCLYVATKNFDQLRPSKIGWRNVRGDLNFSTIDFVFKNTAGRYEEGTPNVPGLYGLGAAIDLLLATGSEAIAAGIKALTDYAVSELTSLGYQVRSPRTAEDWSGIVSFTGDGDDVKRVNAAAAAGIILAHRAGAIRISPHAYNNHADIDRFLEVMRNHRPTA